MNPSFSNKTKTWLNLSEAADLLGVHFTTFRQWADAGDIECMRTPGGRRRFKVEVIVQFLQHHQQAHISYLSTVIENRLINYSRHNLQTSNFYAETWKGQFSDGQTGDVLTEEPFCSYQPGTFPFCHEIPEIAGA